MEVAIVRPAQSSGSTRSDAVGSVDEDCGTTAPALVSTPDLIADWIEADEETVHVMID